MKRRIAIVWLSFILLLSLLPQAVFAGEITDAVGYGNNAASCPAAAAMENGIIRNGFDDVLDNALTEDGSDEISASGSAESREADDPAVSVDLDDTFPETAQDVVADVAEDTDPETASDITDEMTEETVEDAGEGWHEISLEEDAGDAYDLTRAEVTGLENKTYTGEALEPVPVLTLDGNVLDPEWDYSVSYSNNIDAGQAEVTITGLGDYTGTIVKTFTIEKANNTIANLPGQRILAVKQLKKKQVFQYSPVTYGDAKVTFKVLSVPAKAKKYIKVSSAGKVTVKKGLKKGTYKVKLKVTASETKNYQKTEVTKTLKIVVKKHLMKYKSLKKLGVSGYSASVDAKINDALDDMLSTLESNNIKISKLPALKKAYLITLYIGSTYSYKDGSYTAESMLKKGYGTCFAYSELTYCMAKKLGLKNTWLTVAGRNVDHNGKMYGSQHRSVVTKIGKKYYELDSNMVNSMLPYAALGISLTPEQISASYAKYLIGKTNKYKTIN